MKLSRERHIPDETLCPQCGLGAAWIYTDADERNVQVTCPDCGSVEMTRAEFESAESDIVELGEPGE